MARNSKTRTLNSSTRVLASCPWPMPGPTPTGPSSSCAPWPHHTWMGATVFSAPSRKVALETSHVMAFLWGFAVLCVALSAVVSQPRTVHNYMCEWMQAWTWSRLSRGLALEEVTPLWLCVCVCVVRVYHGHMYSSMAGSPFARVLSAFVHLSGETSKKVVIDDCGELE